MYDTPFRQNHRSTLASLSRFCDLFVLAGVSALNAAALLKSLDSRG